MVERFPFPAGRQHVSLERFLSVSVVLVQQPESAIRVSLTEIISKG